MQREEWLALCEMSHGAPVRCLPPGLALGVEDAEQGPSPSQMQPPLKLIGRDKECDFGHMLGLEDTIQVLRHVHIHLDGLGSLETLHQDELPGLPVRALHHEVAAVVASHNAKAQAVRSWPARCSCRGHAEERGGC